jgi:hypothetical protein
MSRGAGDSASPGPPVCASPVDVRLLVRVQRDDPGGLRVQAQAAQNCTGRLLTAGVHRQDEAQTLAVGHMQGGVGR